jgi:hypothetical protein
MAEICYLKVIGLPNFVTKQIDPQSHFSFLNSLSDYSKYYMDLESKKSYSEETKFHYVESINYRLKPLKRYHTMHSYWKSFRRAIEKDVLEGDSSEELFLFLPLIQKVPRPTTLTIDNREFPIKIHVYLFPFGSCCVQMRVIMNEQTLDFDEFIELVHRIPNKSIIKNQMAFEEYSRGIAKTFNEVLFGEKNNIKPFSTHTLIFIGKTSERLTDDENIPISRNHIRAIAGIMADKPLSDISSWTEDNVMKIVSNKLKPGRKEEIILFSHNRTFLYPSPYWVGDIMAGKGREKLESKFKCMFDNYRSFLTLTFALNRFLKECVPSDDNKLLQENENLKRLVKCLTKALSESKSIIDSAFDYKNKLETIDKVIHLQDSLQKLKFK